jgi:hypothetical protein
MSAPESASEPFEAKEALTIVASPRYEGALVVGDVTSGWGIFEAKVDSLVLKGTTLEFDISGEDTVGGKFDVQGAARNDPSSSRYVCPEAGLRYHKTLTQIRPTEFSFAAREVADGDEKLCYLSFEWEDLSGKWTAHGLLEIASNQLAR